MSGNFAATRPYIYIAGNLIDPSQNNSNEGTLYTKHNQAFNEITGHQHTGAVGDAPPISGSSIVLGFTPGSVVFAGATGDFAQDNSNFFWDDTNNVLSVLNLKVNNSATSGSVLFAGASGLVTQDNTNFFWNNATKLLSVQTLKVNSAATSGSILFAGASGLVTQDNSNLFWDDTNNKLVIGSNTASLQAEQIQSLQSLAGGTVGIGAFNADNTNLLSDARLFLYTGGPSAGDPKILWQVNTGAIWTAGIDNSDSDKWKLGASATLGASTAIEVLTTGQVGVGVAPLTTTPLRVSGAVNAHQSGIFTSIFPTYGAAVNFKQGIGFNIFWDGSNWTSGADGVSNGWSALVGYYGSGNMAWHSNASTGGTPQSLTNAAFDALQKIVFSNSGEIFLSAALTSASNSLTKNSPARAWGRTDATATTVSNYEISSVVRSGVGQYDYTLTRAMTGSGVYVVTPSLTGVNGFWHVVYTSVSTFTINTFNTAGVAADIAHGYIVHGPQ